MIKTPSVRMTRSCRTSSGFGARKHRNRTQGAPGAGENALAAPQAALISAIAQGVLGGNLDWNLIGLGAAIGVAACAIDEALRATKRGMLPPLAVGMGIYLPMTLTLLIPVGAAIGNFYERWAKTAANPAFGAGSAIILTGNADPSSPTLPPASGYIAQC